MGYSMKDMENAAREIWNGLRLIPSGKERNLSIAFWRVHHEGGDSGFLFYGLRGF
jgi:hypothetical protein